MNDSRRKENVEYLVRKEKKYIKQILSIEQYCICDITCGFSRNNVKDKISLSVYSNRLRDVEIVKFSTCPGTSKWA